MFTRKISTDSFDQSLLNDRKTNTTDLRPKTHLESEDLLHHSFDPESGEIFQKPTRSSQENNSLGNPPYPPRTPYRNELTQLKNSINQAIPSLVINLIVAGGLSWACYELINASQMKLSEQAKQLTQINQSQSEILDAIDELHDNLSNNLSEALSTKTALPTSDVNMATSTTLPTPQKKTPKKVISLKGVKYLGSIKRHDLHQVLVEIDGKIKSLRIGDSIKEDWSLSAIDGKKIIATTILGNRQIFTLEQSSQ